MILYHGTAEEYAREIIEETTEIPEIPRNYIDFEAMGRDMRLKGEVEELARGLLVVNGYDF